MALCNPSPNIDAEEIVGKAVAPDSKCSLRFKRFKRLKTSLETGDHSIDDQVLLEGMYCVDLPERFGGSVKHSLQRCGGYIMIITLTFKCLSYIG